MNEMRTKVANRSLVWLLVRLNDRRELTEPATARSRASMTVPGKKGPSSECRSEVGRMSNLVKAFNSVGDTCRVNLRFQGGKPTMFICGNNEAAKAAVRSVLDQFGWEAADMGKVQAARAIGPLCMLWCIPGFLRNDWPKADPQGGSL
jgi:predicted dinucleotide-binding enzyme